ncbi:hypothetical protein R3W88_023083 [Solanum pinnatisectum]|uniref:Small ribosomal subunit protein bS18c n=1 Tax=Solanum pinnatisectum TaxID=50273 RepID=A0AAV9LZG2_9SOLN|nr:hypothetical protein R3W88_023083 [Solanum pinnatisectum]
MDKSKRPFLKFKRSFRRRLPPIQSGDRIDYRNMCLISRFISEQGKILSRPRILSLLPLLNNEKQFERTELTARTTGFKARNK